MQQTHGVVHQARQPRDTLQSCSVTGTTVARPGRSEGDSSLEYAEFVAEARRRVVESVVERRSGHLCSSLSALDLVCTVLRRSWDSQARELLSDFVLSKGHAAPAFYAAIGLLDQDLPSLAGALRRLGTPYEGHPSRNSMRHIPVSTGSLGLGLAWSVGRTIALERAGSTRRVVVIISDGELQEGVSFEALHLAARIRPALLTVLVDSNGWQTDGLVGYDPVRLLHGIGIPTQAVDGHNPDEIGGALAVGECDGPLAIVARTVRCAGLPARYRTGPEMYGEKITAPEARDLLRVMNSPVARRD